MKTKSILTASVLALTLAVSGASFAKEAGRSGDGNPKNNASPTVVTRAPVFVFQDGTFVLNPAR